MLIKNVTLDFLTQSYSPFLDVNEQRVDKERAVRFSNSVIFRSLDIVEQSVDKEGNIGLSNSVSEDKSLNKAYLIPRKLCVT